jgi:hypothetical protein
MALMHNPLFKGIGGHGEISPYPSLFLGVKQSLRNDRVLAGIACRSRVNHSAVPASRKDHRVCSAVADAFRTPAGQKEHPVVNAIVA